MSIFLLVILGIIVFAVYATSKTVKADKTPVGITVKTSFGQEGGVDKRVKPETIWIPKNVPVTVQDMRIEGGLIYVGRGLAGADDKYSLEQSLIDPKLPITPMNTEQKFDLGYWPSYSQLSPEARFVFLKWLQDGRKNPSVDIGFVFIFFYGLERRLLSDAYASTTARAEAPDIINEVQRLLRIFGQNDSFRGYASRFVDFARVKFTPSKVSIEVPEENNYREFPISLSVGLSHYCAKGIPVPAPWALYWYQNYPYYRSLRTPAERCKKEFNDLFEKKYQEKFGDGLILTEPKKRLSLSYRPASRSISGPQSLALPSLPDVLSLSRPLTKIQEVVEVAIDELDPYSRYLGRNPNDKNSLAALSLLPKSIDIRAYGDQVTNLEGLIKRGLGDKFGTIFRANEILRFWSFKSADKITKNENMAVVDLLDRLGCLVEPDLRFTNLRIDPAGKMIIFRKPENSPDAPSEEYQLAYLIVGLAMAVSASDGEVSVDEKKQMTNHIQTCLGLSKAERTRLFALFSYLSIAPPQLSAWRKQVDDVNEEQRKSILEFLISVANADNMISPEEIKILKKIYQFLGFDPETIYRDILSAQTAYAQEPVVVKTPEFGSSREFKIPPQRQHEEQALSLDENRLRSIVQDTNRVFGVLKGIFEEENGSSSLPQNEQPTSNSGFPNIANLDSEHSSIVRTLISKDVFPRSEFELLCSGYKLLPDGVIETINECFAETYDDMLIDAEVDLIINQAVSKEILNGRTN